MRAPIEAKLSTKGIKDDVETSPKFVLPKCIKARQSHLRLLSEGQLVPKKMSIMMISCRNHGTQQHVKGQWFALMLSLTGTVRVGKLFEGNLEMNGLFIFCSTLKAWRWAMKCFGFIILINTLDTTLIRPD